MGLSEIRHINNAITISVLSFVSQCSHLSCRSRRFNCLLLVFFRHWLCNTIYITLVGCDWCISILTVLARSCSLSGPLLYRLYDRAKRLVTKPSVISAEKKHLSSVLVSNGYPSSFVQKISKARTAPKKEPVAEFKSTAVLPYVQGVLEPLRRCLEQQGIRTVFKSEMTLRSHLVRPKDTVDPAKQDGVVYRIPYEWGNRKIYA